MTVKEENMKESVSVRCICFKKHIGLKEMLSAQDNQFALEWRHDSDKNDVPCTMLKKQNLVPSILLFDNLG